MMYLSYYLRYPMSRYLQGSITHEYSILKYLYLDRKPPPFFSNFLRPIREFHLERFPVRFNKSMSFTTMHFTNKFEIFLFKFYEFQILFNS